MGNTRALYGTPKDYKYYTSSKDEGGWLRIPRGHLSRVKDLAEEVVDETVDAPAKLTSTIKLRPYQEGIPERVVAHREGILRLGTGFGKSVLALKVAELLQQKTLIIVPRTHIKAQFEAEIERYFQFDPRKLGAGIKVCTLQSLLRAKARAASDLGSSNGAHSVGSSEGFGLVIVDECHTSVAQKSRAVIQSLAPKYLYGLTATPRRSDGQGEAIGFLFGPILVEGDLPRTAPSVELVPFHGHIPVWEYAEIIKHQTENEERNALIASIVQREASAGRKVLVLTKRVAHYEVLYELCVGAGAHTRGGVGAEQNPLREDNRFVKLSSTGSAKARALELDSLRSGSRDFSVLFGTHSLLGTGFDCAALDTLIFAGDLKSDVLTEQSVGRVLRLFEGKPTPRIIDIQDVNNVLLFRQAKERRKFYEKQGWQVTTINS